MDLFYCFLTQPGIEPDFYRTFFSDSKSHIYLIKKARLNVDFPSQFQGPASEQLRHVQIWTVNQAVCRARYAEIGRTVTDNMLCSGWLDVGGRDQCQGDSGGPLVHNGVVVGVCSWGEECALARYPGVNARVSRYTAWIQANA